jgi:hypothetical protein
LRAVFARRAEHLKDASLEEMEALWQEAKLAEKNRRLVASLALIQADATFGPETQGPWPLA